MENFRILIFHLARLRLGNDQQILDQIRQAVRVFHRLFQELNPYLFVINSPIHEGMYESLDGKYRGFEFVRNFSQKFPAIGLQIFELLDFRAD